MYKNSFFRLSIYFPLLSEEPGSEYTPFQQAMAQLSALGITMAFAIVGGVVTGKIESKIFNRLNVKNDSILLNTTNKN